jgi:thiaminase II
MVHALGPKAILLKGGHMPLTDSYIKATTESEQTITVDILYEGDDNFTLVESKYLTSRNTHGTGCSLASAIASNLAQQAARSGSLSLPLAVRKAVRYVSTGILTAPSLGHGSGPINHFHTLQIQPFSAGNFIEYLLSHPAVNPVWKAYTQHEFPRSLARGTLPESLFKNYLIQDYLYLTHFARTHALAAYKSKNMSRITPSADIILHIQREMDLHLSYCAEFGISKSDLEDPSRRESLACVAYSRYVLDVGNSEDWLALQISLLPCLLGYGEAAQHLYNDPQSVKTEQGNKYWRWVENYVAEDYQQAITTGRALIEGEIVRQSPSRVEELVRIFVRATEMEVRFWDFDAHPEE